MIASNKQPRSGVRAAILLLLLVPILVPIFAIALIWIGDRDAVRVVEDRVQASARLTAADVTKLVGETRARLDRIDKALGADPSTFSLDGIDTGAGLVGLYSARGESIGRNGTRGASVADNDQFQALAHGKPWLITPLIGVSGAMRLFGIAHRIDRDGTFAGVVTAYIPADYLSPLWASLALGADSTLGLIRDDGWIVTRFPVPDRAVNLSGSDLFSRHLKRSPSGVYHSPSSPVDGRPRLVGYVHIDDLGLIAVASISEAVAGEGFWKRVVGTGIVTIPMFLTLVMLCGWIAWLLLRQERSRAALQAALADNRVLLQEIHHRVKNNLQAVSAMVQLQAAPADMKADLTGRIAAMTAVHQHIYETDQFGEVDASAYLGKLLEGLKSNAPPRIALDWKLAPLEIEPEQAMPLGLLVNELVTNAFKHGFPAGRSGAVHVLLEPQGEDAVLVVSDTGIGKPEGGSAGLGTRLISGFVNQLKGRSSVKSDGGTVVEVVFRQLDLRTGSRAAT